MYTVICETQCITEKQTKYLACLLITISAQCNVSPGRHNSFTNFRRRFHANSFACDVYFHLTFSTSTNAHLRHTPKTSIQVETENSENQP